VKLEIEIPYDSATPAVDKLLAALNNPTGLNEAILPEAERLTKSWIRANAQFRHETATRLGGEPTGELERAAGKVTGKADATAATVQLGSPLLARAFRDVTIKPGAGKQYLTIPISGPAYGKRVGEFERSVGDLFALFGGNEKGGVLVHKEKGKKFATAHYLLVPEVTQKHDPTLLPDDALYLDAARQGVATFLEGLFEV
jgi:hypothetical protein